MEGLFDKAFDGLPAPRMRAVQARGLKRRLAVYRLSSEADPVQVKGMEAEIARLEAPE